MQIFIFQMNQLNMNSFDTVQNNFYRHMCNFLFLFMRYGWQRLPQPIITPFCQVFVKKVCQIKSLIMIMDHTLSAFRARFNNNPVL